MSERHSAAHDLAIDGLKASPVAGGFALHAQGITLENWVLIASLVYTVFLIAEKLWKWRVPQRAYNFVRPFIRYPRMND